MTDHSLKKRLEQAAAGRVAEGGAEAVNLPAEALKELERLWSIEKLVKVLYDIAPQNYPTRKETSYFSGKITGDAIHDRYEAGRRLGAAVGALGFKGSP